MQPARVDLWSDDATRIELRNRAAQELLLGGPDEDVDLPTAGEADCERLVVRDPVRAHPRSTAREHLPRLVGDLGLDAAARHRPGDFP
jgi:hypothetical protein